jgi:hypothetical protein
MRGKTMPERMAGHPLGNARLAHRHGADGSRSFDFIELYDFDA